MITTERLAEVLGADYWTAAFPTPEAATEHACRRMDEGREAVTFTDPAGRHVAAWGCLCTDTAETLWDRVWAEASDAERAEHLALRGTALPFGAQS